MRNPTRMTRHEKPAQWERSDCPTCNATGRAAGEDCPRCLGATYIMRPVFRDSVFAPANTISPCDEIIIERVVRRVFRRAVADHEAGPARAVLRAYQTADVVVRMLSSDYLMTLPRRVTWVRRSFERFVSRDDARRLTKELFDELDRETGGRLR